jgi:hypothetical protein
MARVELSVVRDRAIDNFYIGSINGVWVACGHYVNSYFELPPRRTRFLAVLSDRKTPDSYELRKHHASMECDPRVVVMVGNVEEDPGIGGWLSRWIHRFIAEHGRCYGSMEYEQ